jgi:hypothetical protein
VDFVAPRAAKPSGDADYGPDDYPNTDGDGINDSVSSIKNRLTSNDVVWFFNAGYGGTSFCLDPGWVASPLNSHNDEYSSHLLAALSTC